MVFPVFMVPVDNWGTINCCVVHLSALELGHWRATWSVYMPRHVRIKSPDSKQQRGWLCRCNSWSQQNFKVQQHHLRRWLRAGGYRNVRCLGMASFRPRQPNWSLNRGSDTWTPFNSFSTSTHVGGSAASERILCFRYFQVKPQRGNVECHHVINEYLKWLLLNTYHHGCTVAQAVVMVTTVLLGNGYFGQPVIKKPWTIRHQIVHRR